MASSSGTFSGEANGGVGRHTPSVGRRCDVSGRLSEMPCQTLGPRCPLLPRAGLDWARLDLLIAMGRRAIAASSLESGWAMTLSHAVEAAEADAGLLFAVTPAGQGRLVASQGFCRLSDKGGPLSRSSLWLDLDRDLDLMSWARAAFDLPSEARCFESTLVGRDGPCGLIALFWLQPCADASRSPPRDPFLTRVAEAVAQSLDTMRLGSNLEQAQKELKQTQKDFEQAQKELWQAQTACKQAQEHSEQARREIDQASQRDRRRRAFLGAIAHELTSALNALNGSIHLSDELRTRAPEHLARSRRVVDLACHRLSRLIGDLGDLGRLGLDRFSLRLSRVDVRTILTPSLNACARELAGSGVSLIADLGDEPLVIEADGDRLVQIVDNLLVNARRHTQSGFIKVRAWREDTGEIALSVKDSGSGLDKETLAALFEPFWSERARWHSHLGGMGMGLCLSREIVARLGGRMWARSDGPGQGSDFELRFRGI